MKRVNHFWLFSFIRSASRRIRQIVCCITLFSIAVPNLSLSPLEGTLSSQYVLERKQCEAPTLHIAVLTMSRADSLRRLTVSLKRAYYGCAQVHLSFYIDMPPNAQYHDDRTMRLVSSFAWPYGEKYIVLQPQNVGLAKSWFSVKIGEMDDYVLILEDDMELSAYFYVFFSNLEVHGLFADENITSLCLHPGDWEINIDVNCKTSTMWNAIYETPEPCNWAPIWRARSWRAYMRWIDEMKTHNRRPYVPHEIAYNYNIYLDKLYDVQSPWVWRYNWENGQRSIRYSFSKCDSLLREQYLAVNHKESGLHFPSKKRSFFAQKRKLVSNKSVLERMNAIMFKEADEYGRSIRPYSFKNYKHVSELLPQP